MPAAAGADDQQRAVFRSPGAALIWYGWLLFAAANVADLAIQGRDHASAMIAAVLALITGGVYVVALRPKIVADSSAVTVRNPLRDVRVPWGAVTSIELKDVVGVHYQVEAVSPVGQPRQRVVHAWALQSSRRSRMRAQRRARARASKYPVASPGFGKLPEEVRQLATQPLAVTVIAQLDGLRARANQRGAAGGRPVVTWSGVSIAALGVPAVLVTVIGVLG